MALHRNQLVVQLSILNKLLLKFIFISAYVFNSPFKTWLEANKLILLTVFKLHFKNSNIKKFKYVAKLIKEKWVFDQEN
jgi:hypothetical protein